IRPGTYQVKVVADGYESYEKRVNISIGRESEVAAWLEKKAVKSRLFVNTEPENADVRILNIRPKFYQGMDLELGDYHLEVSADRCERVRKWITLYEGKYEGKYETVHFSLNCKPEKVEVDDSKYEAFLKAEEFFHKRDYSQALESYNDYLSEFPDGHYAPAALMKEGTIYTESGKYSTARNIYQYLINRYPDSPLVPDARVVILSTYYKEGEYDRVIRRTENVLKNIVSEDHIFITHVLCGDAYMASGSPINAVYFYITACKKKFGTVPCPDGETENVSAKMNIAIKRLSPADIKALQERLDDDSVGYVIPVGHR
ncbi:MAG: tetratricopeptide repeat protein, partial [Desulfobacteraceae bacterium]|nr:tetratricopeptide repeat protein [Desulfobacteraceae bacterium]